MIQMLIYYQNIFHWTYQTKFVNLHKKKTWIEKVEFVHFTHLKEILWMFISKHIVYFLVLGHKNR